MKISIAQAIKYIPFVAKANFPIMLRGPHGIGKSQLVEQIAESLNLPVISRRASQMTEGDLLGLPVIQDSITHFAPPEWFQAACKDPCVLFIDELDRAPAGVRQGFFELADSRRLAGNNLHPETLIFSAINGGHNENRYDTFVLDPAEADRWTVFDLAPTVEDWVAWGRKNSKIQQGILDFIVEYPTHLEHKGEFEPGKKYPSRRSWHRFNDACTLRTMERDGIIMLCSAFVGFEAAIAFAEHYFSRKYVSPEDILEGDISGTTDYVLSQHCDLIERLYPFLLKEMTSEQIRGVAKYMLTLPSEAAMMIYMKFGYGEYAERNTKNLLKTNVSGVSMRDFLRDFVGKK